MADPAVPTAYQTKVDRLRRWLGDEATLNKLLQGQESTDAFLYECIDDALDEINFTPPNPTTPFTIDTFPSWAVLKLGATLQVLTGKGILSARNTLSYNDTGGVTIKDYDTYGRYINYFNILINKYRLAIQNMKIGANIDAVYGGVPSEYSLYLDTEDYDY